MIAIAINIQNRRTDEALRRMPGAIISRADQALDRGSQEFAREARRRVSKARSTLANAINARKVGELHYEVSTGVGYGRAVEEGTGPAAGKGSYMPNPVMLEDYVKQRSGVSFAARRGSAGREVAERSVRSRAFALAVYIRQHGTKAHPFMAPTRAVMEPRIRELVGEAVDAGVTEVLRG